MFNYSMCIVSLAVITIIFSFLIEINSKFSIGALMGICLVGLICIYSFSFDRVEVIKTIALVSVLEQGELENTYSIEFREDLKEPVIEKVKVYGLYDIIYKTDERLVIPYPEDKN